MKKIVFALVAVFAVCFTSCKSNENSDKIRVGVLMPLTGDIAYIGQSYLNAILMAVDTSKVKLFVDDTKSEAKTAMTIVNKMLSIDKVDVVISAVPAVSEAVNPILEKNDVLHFALTFSPEISKFDNVVKLFPSSDEEVRSYLKYALECGAKDVVFLRHMFPDAELAFKSVVMPESVQMGLNVIDVPFDLSTSDFNNLTLKVKSYNPDIVIVQSLSYNFLNISRSFHQQNVLKKMVGDLNFGDLYSCYDYSEAIEMNGIPFLSVDYVVSDSYLNFKNQYITLYNAEPHYLSAFLYDVTNVINNMDVSGKTKEQIVDYYNNRDIPCITSDVLKFDVDGDQVVGYDVFTFKNGEYIVY